MLVEFKLPAEHAKNPHGGEMSIRGESAENSFRGEVSSECLLSTIQARRILNVACVQERPVPRFSNLTDLTVRRARVREKVRCRPLRFVPSAELRRVLIQVY